MLSGNKIYTPSCLSNFEGAENADMEGYEIHLLVGIKLLPLVFYLLTRRIIALLI